MARPDLANHRKFKALRARFKDIPSIYLEAHLETMWKVGWNSGDPFLGDAEAVETAAEWYVSGKPAGEWFKAMIELKWIDDLEDGNYQIHDLLENSPAYVQRRRSRDCERKKKKLCERCGSEFQSAAANARFCSDSCKQLEWISQKRLTAIDGNLRQVDVNLRQIDGTPSPSPSPSPINTNTSVAAQREQDKPARPPKPPKPRKVKPPEHPNHKPLVEHWCQAWERKYGIHYQFIGGKDGSHIAMIRKSCDENLPMCRRVVDAYLRDDRDFIKNRRHNLGFLAQNINEYRDKANRANGNGEWHSKSDYEIVRAKI